MVNKDLDKVLEYVNNSANKARDLMFQDYVKDKDGLSNTRHITTIIVCEQVAKFVKKLQKENKENDWNTYLHGNSERP
tara:strand:- start:478 stop:711 length:234 start_codon:yes stop_codon:yes gene_type:complete